VTAPTRTERPEVVALGETMLSVVAVGAPVDRATTFHVTHGGAESNACVGLSRLGLPAVWVGALGTDAAGDRIASALGSEGVDLRWVRRDPARPTGLMLRDTLGDVRYYRSGSAASACPPDALDGVPIRGAGAVFTTGITAMIGDAPGRAAAELLRRGREAGARRVVDVNLRTGLWGSDRAVELVTPLLALADLVLGGAHELEAFAPGVEGRRLARRIADLGPSEVVLKLGSRGACALDARTGEWLEHAPEPGPDVDPVGAGDAFDAGYLAARLGGRPIADALAHGATCGAAVAATVGDTEGFPTRAPVPRG
jgi:2-dehydro-3-deoxygluconokinase